MRESSRHKTGNCHHLMFHRCWYNVFSTFCVYWEGILNIVLLNQDRHCLWQQCRSRSDGFFRSHLIRIYTVFHGVCEFTRTNNIELYDWLPVRNGCGRLYSFNRIRVKTCWPPKNKISLHIWSVLLQSF